MSNRSQIIKLLDEQFKAIIQEVGLKSVVIALSNACAHGTIFGTSIDDEGLGKLYEKGIDPLLAITKKLAI